MEFFFRMYWVIIESEKKKFWWYGHFKIFLVLSGCSEVKTTLDILNSNVKFSPWGCFLFWSYCYKSRGIHASGKQTTRSLLNSRDGREIKGDCSANNARLWYNTMFEVSQCCPRMRAASRTGAWCYPLEYKKHTSTFVPILNSKNQL